jgi:hypothetical protein
MARTGHFLAIRAIRRARAGRISLGRAHTSVAFRESGAARDSEGITMLHHTHRMRRTVAAAMLAAGVATGAQANWFASYSGPTSYWAKFTKVPDFDQVRNGLPNNGNMYCVPTSAVNWMAYIAHHGYPTIMPGDHTQQYWHAQSTFNLSNFFLTLMGNYMQTDPFDGTWGGPAKDGLDIWLDNRFVVINRWINSTETPDFDDIAAYTRLKIPVMACVGWYSDNNNVLTRNGGHCFSVVKVQRQGNTRLLTMHDPADEQSNIFTQSAVAQRTYQIEPRVKFVAGQWRVVDKVLNYGSGYLDTYFAIFPLYGLSTSVDFTDLIVLKPFQLTIGNDPIIDPVPAPGIITSVLPSPFDPSSIVTTAPVPGGPPSTIWRFDPESREFDPLVEVADAQRAVFDRFGRLYVLDGRTIRCFNPFGEQFEEEASVVPAGQTLAMAHNDVSGHLLALLGDGSVVPFENGLNQLPAVQVPPEPILEGKRFMAASTMGPGFFVTSEGSPAIYKVFPPDPIRAVDEHEWEYEIIGAEAGIDRPSGLSVGDDDCVFVTDASGKAKVFCQDPETGEWMEDREHPMSGLEVGAGVQMARSRTNFDPEIHQTEEFVNILPEDFAPEDMGCFADLNDDFVVDGADLGVLLGAWGAAGEEIADLNGDGAVDGADLGLMLGEWGDCPI